MEKCHQEFTVLLMLAWTRTLNKDVVGDFLVRSFAVYAVKNHVFTSSGRVFHEFFHF